MEFNITGPYCIVYFYSCLGKIRTLVSVIVTGKNYLQGLSICSCQAVFIKISQLPNELEKPFGHVKSIKIRGKFSVLSETSVGKTS